MARLDVQVSTPDGACPAVLLTPEGAGPWPAVIVFMDAGGVREAIVEIGEHIAALGYVALVPEMYYRHGPYEPFRIETAFTDPDERQRLGELAGGLSKEMAVSDTGAFLEFLDNRPEVGATMVGTTGYCMGGALSLTAAAHHPDRIGAAASFHGGHLVTDAPDSPHRVVAQITGRVCVAGALDDGSFTREQAEQLEQALTDGGVDHVVETYPAAHGFAVADNPTYDAEADRRHLDALRDLFGQMLGD
ncbi:MAG: dienelactone hydrolase family protein [Acidimicrobiales bacterium]